MSELDVSRRDLLQTSGLIAVAAMAGGPAARAEVAITQPAKAQRARNIIFCVSDGMSLSVPSITEPFAQLLRGRGTAWYDLAMSRDAVAGFFETFSLDSLVTDSAAASSAWGSGSRVCNSAINVLPDGRALLPISKIVRAVGKRVGLVTTATVTHATPAGFAASVSSRGDEGDIAVQYLDEVDVILGGGEVFFSPALRPDRRDLIGEFQRSGYVLSQHRRELVFNPPASRMLGLYSRAHLPYTVDHIYDPQLRETTPTLAEMTQAAIASLDQNPAGFLLQVEGARIDHAGHANDPAGLLFDQLAFDDAVAVCVNYARQRGDTLVVVTADHATGNPGLNGMGPGYRETDAVFARLTAARGSYERLRELINHARSNEVPLDQAVRVHLAQMYGVKVSNREAEAVAEAFAGRGNTTEIERQQMSPEAMLGQVLANHVGIAWTGISHTAEQAAILALGPGSDRFGGLMKNTAAFGHMLGVFGLDYRNPSITREEYKQQIRDAAATQPASPRS